jgi:hypothetical protein
MRAEISALCADNVARAGGGVGPLRLFRKTRERSPLGAAVHGAAGLSQTAIGLPHVVTDDGAMNAPRHGPRTGAVRSAEAPAGGWPLPRPRARDIDDLIDACAARQHGVVARAQLLTAGGAGARHRPPAAARSPPADPSWRVRPRSAPGRLRRGDGGRLGRGRRRATEPWERGGALGPAAAAPAGFARRGVDAGSPVRSRSGVGSRRLARTTGCSAVRRG